MANKLTPKKRVELGQKGESKVIQDLKKKGATKIWQAPGSKGASDIKATLGNNKYHIQVKTSSTKKVPALTSEEKRRINISSTKAGATSVKAEVTPQGIAYSYVNQSNKHPKFKKKR